MRALRSPEEGRDSDPLLHRDVPEAAQHTERQAGMKHVAVAAFVFDGHVRGLCSCGSTWAIVMQDGESRDFLRLHILDANRSEDK